ncbi:hypothetical protein AGMMS49983_15250 [Clostridia bacterium]|nr:hypothetical protein AGMMS49983_15250 [Clostridia bacterium]
MESTELATQQQQNVMAELTNEEKVKVAYALNLCAVSVSQIIDSKDIIVLKQEREYILNNLNLQNFVKHPALLDVLKRVLDTITYLEIQAGDLSFVEKEYQHKLKNAIWTALPSPSAFFAGGDPVSIAIAVVTQLGTGYMNYRRNKSQYALEKDRSEWELRRHEIEQLEGLRAQLFETSWKLSSDYDFDDKYRLSLKQLSRFSTALLELEPLKRYEMLDVLSDKFSAFPPFWYYKGNAAMEVYRNQSGRYGEFASAYRAKALNDYREFEERYFEFLREDVIAASCCIEHISLLNPADDDYSNRVEKLLHKALRLAGENYDVLQQSVLVSLRLGKVSDVINPLREMIANDYNVGLNWILLGRIYLEANNHTEYEKLRAIAGADYVLPWADDTRTWEQKLLESRKPELSEEYRQMAQRIVKELTLKKAAADTNGIYDKFRSVSDSVLRYCVECEKELADSFAIAAEKLSQAIVNASGKTYSNKLTDFNKTCEQTADTIKLVKFTLQIAEDAPSLIEQMREVV